MERKRSIAAKTKKDPVDDPEELLACAVCGLIMFENKASLLRHLRYHFHKERENLECEICRRIFFSKNSLSSHVKVHSFDRNLPCGVCGKMFKWPGSLKSHVENHSREKLFYCHICDKTFGVRHNHIKNREIILQTQEMADELNSGEIIPVVFKSGNNGLKAVKPPDDPSSIVSNLLTNVDMTSLPLLDLPPLPSLSADPPQPQVSLNISSKPVKCISCSRTFYDMDNLNEHMIKYHGVPNSLMKGVAKSSMGGATNSLTGVKTKSTPTSEPMKCPTCLESFPDLKTLKVHINSHTEVYKCSLCNSFINGGDLRDHIKYHSKHKGSKVLLFNKL